MNYRSPGPALLQGRYHTLLSSREGYISTDSLVSTIKMFGIREQCSGRRSTSLFVLPQTAETVQASNKRARC